MDDIQAEDAGGEWTEHGQEGHGGADTVSGENIPLQFSIDGVPLFQATNTDLARQINNKMFEVSALQSDLPGIVSRCSAEQSRQARDVMHR